MNTGGHVSALDVELFRSRLSSTIFSMNHLLYRSAYSTLMRESRDCSFMLVGPAGEVLVRGPGHFHHATYRTFTHAVLQKFPEVHPGDLFLTNHPYEAGIPHSPDLGLLAPAFVDGRLVGFSCTIAHKADFGGAVVGSATMESTHIFQEGLLIPPVLVQRNGELDHAIVDIIRSNIRDADLFFGDMRAQLGVTTLGASRLESLARATGVDTLFGIYDQLLAQGEAMLRSHVSSWPDGSVAVDGFIDNDGVDLDTPVRLALGVTVDGDSIVFDFRGTDDQARGPVNMPRTYAETAVTYALLAMSDCSFGYNDGVMRPVSILHRAGSVLSPKFPAPVGAATSVHHRLIDVCLQALGHFVPERASGHSGGSGGTLAISWRRNTPGARSLQYEVIGTAMGGLADQDGPSGVCVYCTNLAITPVEVIEAQFPVLIRRFELLQDSSGPGRHRGGLSYRREYEAREPASVIRRAERGRFAALGVHGGSSGRTAHVVITRADGQPEDVPVAGRYELHPGDRICVEGAGAGGYGDPLTRPVDEVALDVQRGYVSVEAAARDYGVVVDARGVVDKDATEVLRSEMTVG